MNADFTHWQGLQSKEVPLLVGLEATAYAVRRLDQPYGYFLLFEGNEVYEWDVSTRKITKSAKADQAMMDWVASPQGAFALSGKSAEAERVWQPSRLAPESLTPPWRLTQVGRETVYVLISGQVVIGLVCEGKG